MSATAIVIDLMVAVLLLLAAALLLGMCRNAARADRAAERQAQAPVDSYQGPDSLRLLEDLEAHMKAYGNEVADYYDTTTGDR